MFKFFNKDLNIFLIRHGESKINTGENLKDCTPVHLVSLTENGKLDSDKSAKYLSLYLDYKKLNSKKSCIFYSPYKVTEETMNIFNKHLKISNIKQEISLIERRFGTAELLPWQTWIDTYKDEAELFYRYYDNSGKFYAKFHLGDAPFDTALRVGQAIDRVMSEYKNSKVKNVFIFTHGITLRAFVMRFCNYSVEWYENQVNPDNCAIYHLTYTKNKIIDNGFIHDKNFEKKLMPKKKGFLRRLFLIIKSIK